MKFFQCHSRFMVITRLIKHQKVIYCNRIITTRQTRFQNFRISEILEKFFFPSQHQIHDKRTLLQIVIKQIGFILRQEETSVSQRKKLSQCNVEFEGTLISFRDRTSLNLFIFRSSLDSPDSPFQFVFLGRILRNFSLNSQNLRHFKTIKRESRIRISVSLFHNGTIRPFSRHLTALTCRQIHLRFIISTKIVGSSLNFWCEKRAPAPPKRDLLLSGAHKGIY